MSDIINYSEKTFEDIKHLTDDGVEFWYARELQIVLGYAKWEKFQNVIEKSTIACENSKNAVPHHFLHVGKMVKAGISEKDIGDIQLSRYACYLIVQNGDPRKKVIALGQTYFAVKTRQQELSEFKNLDEDDRRLELRGTIKGFNKKLAETAYNAGVNNFGRFQNFGYRGLYKGETAADIKERKGLKKNEEILDNMGATELAANYFRITQTEEKIRNEQISGEDKSNDTHYKVGKTVRKTMIEISGKAPEELPLPEKSIKQIDKEKRKLIK